jgi:phosphoribosyl-ATP pyrophosphohydrolase
MNDDLNELFALIKSRRGGDPKSSYIAKLFDKGREKISQKVGEEAVEVVIEAVAKKRRGVISESADLMFHLMILWAEMGVSPDEVTQELRKRKGISGIEEKKNRKE